MCESVSRNVTFESKKLLIICQRWCGVYGLKLEAAELLNEAITRIIECDRHVPKNENFVKALSWICKSIAEAMCISNVNKQQELESTLLEVEEALDHGLKHNICIETELIAEQKEKEANDRLALVLEYFKDDEAILRLFYAIIGGSKAREIVIGVFGGDQKAYDTTRKRFTRGIAKMQMEEVR